MKMRILNELCQCTNSAVSPCILSVLMFFPVGMNSPRAMGKIKFYHCHPHSLERSSMLG